MKYQHVVVMKSKPTADGRQVILQSRNGPWDYASNARREQNSIFEIMQDADAVWIERWEVGKRHTLKVYGKVLTR